MSQLKGNLIIAQGGGPTAVINNSLCGIIEGAFKHKEIKGIYGALNGINGVLNKEIIDLNKESQLAIKSLKNTPGSALGSCRRKLEEKDYERIIEVFMMYKIRYFFYIGGNDSMDTVNKVHHIALKRGYELRAIGVPKTVDNDLTHTDHCPGYGSAARYIAISTMEVGIDNESLPPPICIIETMGRNTGWLAAASLLAKEREEDAPHLIYVPERKFNTEAFLEDVNRIYKRLKRVTIVASEGVKDEYDKYLGSAGSNISRDGFGHSLPGGAGGFMADLISARLKLRARYEKPGICARASILCVSKTDQKEAYIVGTAAVKEAVRGMSGYMIGLDRKRGLVYNCITTLIDLKDVANAERMLPDKFITKESNFIKDSFRKYALPLIGEPLPRYVRLKKYRRQGE